MRKIVSYLLGTLLIALPLLGVLAQDVSAASSRVAAIKELKGTVKVKKSGGSKEFTAFAKMTLNEGDVLTVGQGGSAVLQFANGTSEDDQMSVGADTTLTFSKLTEGKSTITKVSMLNGSVWSTVKSIKNKDDQFTLETPTAIMGVRGTNLQVRVNPITGGSTFIIASGLGRITPTNTAQGDEILLYPSQQISIDGGNGQQNPQQDVHFVDLDELIQNASPALIAAIIKSKEMIDQENEELLARLKQELEQGQPDSNLDLKNQDDLDRYSRNLEFLIGNIIKDALKNNKIGKDELDRLIEEENKKLTKKIDLDNVVPPELTDREKQKLELAKKQQKEREEQARLLKEQELQRQQFEILNRLEEIRKKQEEANRLALAEKNREAIEAYEKQLTELERRKFEEERNQREQELKNRTATPSPSPSQTGSTGGGGGGGGGSSGPSQSPSPSPSQSTPPPNPTGPLPEGISGWLTKDAAGQELTWENTIDNGQTSLFVTHTSETTSSISMQLGFGPEVGSVILSYYGENETSGEVAWTASGQTHTISGLQQGTIYFSISVIPADYEPQGSGGVGPSASLVLLNGGDYEPDWAGIADPLLISFGEGQAEYTLNDAGQFEVFTSLENDQMNYNINDVHQFAMQKVVVNGTAYPANEGSIALQTGVNVVEFKVADSQWQYFKHTFTFIVTRQALPLGVESWSLKVGQDPYSENPVVVASYPIDIANPNSMYAKLPSVSENDSIWLDIKLKDGYMGLNSPYEGETGPDDELSAGDNTVVIQIHGDGYYRNRIEISDTSESSSANFELTLRVGENERPYNSELNAGGIELSVSESGYTAEASYAGNQTFVAHVPEISEEGDFAELDLGVFMDNFDLYYLGYFGLGPNDVQVRFNGVEASQEFYFYGELIPGLNEITINVDPLRLFGSDGAEYKLLVYAGSISESLRFTTLEGEVGDIQAPYKFLTSNGEQPLDSLYFEGMLSSSYPGEQFVRLQLTLNDPTTAIDSSWLEGQMAENGESGFLSASGEEGSYEVRYYYKGYGYGYLNIQLVAQNGSRIVYGIRIEGVSL